MYYIITLYLYSSIRADFNASSGLGPKFAEEKHSWTWNPGMWFMATLRLKPVKDLFDSKRDRSVHCFGSHFKKFIARPSVMQPGSSHQASLSFSRCALTNWTPERGIQANHPQTIKRQLSWVVTFISFVDWYFAYIVHTLSIAISQREQRHIRWFCTLLVTW